MESKFCPKLGGFCLGADCPWFNRTTDKCGGNIIWAIAYYLK